MLKATLPPGHILGQVSPTEKLQTHQHPHNLPSEELSALHQMQLPSQGIEKPEILYAWQRYRYDAEKQGRTADYAIFERIYYGCPNTPALPPGITHLPLPTPSLTANQATKKKLGDLPKRYRRKYQTTTNAEIGMLADKLSALELDEKMPASKEDDKLSRLDVPAEFYVGKCTCIECVMDEVNATPMDKTVSQLPARYRNRPSTPGPVKVRTRDVIKNLIIPGSSKAKPSAPLTSRSLNYTVDEDIPLYFGKFVTRSPLAAPEPSTAGVENSNPTSSKEKGKGKADLTAPNPTPRLAPKTSGKKVHWAPDIPEHPKRPDREFSRSQENYYKPGRWSNTQGWQNTSWARYNSAPGRTVQGQKWRTYEDGD